MATKKKSSRTSGKKKAAPRSRRSSARPKKVGRNKPAAKKKAAKKKAAKKKSAPLRSKKQATKSAVKKVKRGPAKKSIPRPTGSAGGLKKVVNKAASKKSAPKKSAAKKTGSGKSGESNSTGSRQKGVTQKSGRRNESPASPARQQDNVNTNLPEETVNSVENDMDGGDKDIAQRDDKKQDPENVMM